jgi:Dyp-type peroxidase family
VTLESDSCRDLLRQLAQEMIYTSLRDEELLTASVVDRNERQKRLLKLTEEGRKQPGIEFPAPSDQPYILVIRANLSRQVQFGREADVDIVRQGLRRLCGLFERINKGEKTIDELGDDGKLVRKHLFKDYKFRATIGFGIGFFDLLNVSTGNRPKNLGIMPDSTVLGDPTPYSLAQTDLIIQVASSNDFINRYVLENALQAAQQQNETTGKDLKKTDCPEGVILKPNQICCIDGEIIDIGEKCTPDITSALEGWATIVDVNAGFQRLDGRNLMGFNDGVSNVVPGSGAAFDDVVWTTMQDEGENLKDGTYVVFQKIEHDLDQWRQLSLAQQEDWVGRKKITGLLKGTLSDEEDKILGQNLNSPNNRVREEAQKKLKEHIKQQRDPSNRFYDDIRFKNAVPAWSHIRKANPREELIDKNKGNKNGRIAKHQIFRRGYMFVENDQNNDVRSGLLFICFQRNINEGFEFIKKNWLNNKNFPIPFSGPNLKRMFTAQELCSRHKHGRLTLEELFQIKSDLSKRRLLGLEADKDFIQALRDAGFDARRHPIHIAGSTTVTDSQNTGREGLAGPSEMGVIPAGQFLAIVPKGGGYYYVPPIPNKSVRDIGQQFFDFQK